MADHHFFTRIFQHPLQGAVSPNIEFIFEEVIGQLPGLFYQLFEPLHIELFRAFDLRGLLQLFGQWAEGLVERERLAMDIDVAGLLDRQQPVDIHIRFRDRGLGPVPVMQVFGQMHEIVCMRRQFRTNNRL